MPRKRTPDKSSTDGESTTATTTAESPIVNEPDAATGLARPEPVGSAEPPQSFAERVGGPRKATTTTDPYGIAGDYVAGVRLFESRRERQMAIKFDEKPGQPVIDTLKAAGYRWNSAEMVWVHPVRPESAMSTRIEAERLYQEVRQMVRQDKGIEAGPEIPF